MENYPEQTDRTPYVETFDNGPGGWITWGSSGAQLPEVRDGVVYFRSPWWVDFNHAPPGGGYLHLLMALHTHPKYVIEIGRPNRFLEQGKSRNFTDAKMTVRLRGEVDLRGAQMVLWVQADVLHPRTRVNLALTGQPFRITKDWSEQTVTLSPDPEQWVNGGSRWDRTETYGWGFIQEALQDLNADFILVLFPLKVVPVGDIKEPEMHILAAGKDYEIDARYLPKGEIQIDTVKVEYAP